MKKIFKYMVMATMSLGLAMTGTSCTDYLDKAEESDISDVDAFKDFTNFQGYTEMLYANIPDFCRGYWTNSFNWGDDEVISTDVNYHMVYKIDNGDFWGWQAEHDGWGTGWLDRGGFSPTSSDRFNNGLWPAAWWSIRHANMGLENLDKLTDATPAQKNAIAGQLYFFRAWYHFMLIQYFGGLPYIDKTLDANAQINEARLTYRECADRCAADFRKAADLLPVNWDATQISPATNGNNEMRVNKITALAYLGKNYLWAASPLMNATNKGVTDYVAEAAKTSSQTKPYDQEYCKKAAEAFGELLNLVETNQTQYALVDYSKITDVFYTYGQSGKTPGSTEALWRNLADDGYNGCRWGWLLQYTVYPYNVGGCKLSCCANYVNYYGMANGLPLDDPDSGFDPTHPWKDRDPRFYQDFRYDGVFMSEHKDYTPDFNDYKMYTGSPSRDVIQGCRTGYTLLKYQSVDCNDGDDGYGWSPHLTSLVSYMRLADVYLMYAEAAAMADNSPRAQYKVNLTALEAVNTIRSRCGLKRMDSKYSGNIDGFMSELRRERAVELSYEGHRFNDLRRWLLLTDPAYADKTSQEFDRAGSFNPEKPKENAVSNFREVVIVHREYGNKHYWLPLKKKDCNISADFPQNPGW